MSHMELKSGHQLVAGTQPGAGSGVAPLEVVRVQVRVCDARHFKEGRLSICSRFRIAARSLGGENLVVCAGSIRRRLFA